jgi:hypothetical protein
VHVSTPSRIQAKAVFCIASTTQYAGTISHPFTASATPLPGASLARRPSAESAVLCNKIIAIVAADSDYQAAGSINSNWSSTLSELTLILQSGKGSFSSKRTDYTSRPPPIVQQGGPPKIVQHVGPATPPEPAAEEPQGPDTRPQVGTVLELDCQSLSSSGKVGHAANIPIWYLFVTVGPQWRQCPKPGGHPEEETHKHMRVDACRGSARQKRGLWSSFHVPSLASG